MKSPSKLFSIAKILGTFATLQVFAQGVQMLTAILVIQYSWNQKNFIEAKSVRLP